MSGMAAEVVLDLDARAAPLQSSLRSAYTMPGTEWRVLMPTSADQARELTLSPYKPFANSARVFLDEAPLGPKDYDQTARYARGHVIGNPKSFALLILRANGDASLVVTENNVETRMTISGGSRSMEQRIQRPLNPTGSNPFLDDAVLGSQRGFKLPSKPLTSRPESLTPVATASRTEVVSGAGWSSVYSLEIPAGQALTGVISKGPGNAGVVIMKDLDPTVNWASSTCSDGSSLYSSCLIENPAAGTYYVAAYKFDSSDTTLVFNFADDLSATEQLRATIAIDTDGGFYGLSEFATTDDILDYFAALFAYSSSIYEAEVNTALQIGDVFLFSPSGDPYTPTTNTSVRLSEVEAYWQANRTGVPRTLAAHFSAEQFGGRAYLDALCSEAYGYSVTGAYGIAPGAGAPINQDAHFFSHEIGHNFSSPHTHCYAGVGGNPDPVDACYNGESSCYSGTESLPGTGALTGGSSGAANGTIMSYCHLRSGGSSNIAATLGASHPFGVAASRVSTAMADRVFEIAAIDQSCISTTTIAYTVTPSALSGGSINPSVAQTVSTGDTADFILATDAGYVTGEMTGTCPGSLEGDTFTAGPITEDCTVIANFTAITEPTGLTIDQTDVGDGEIFLYVSAASNGGAEISSYDAVCTDGSAAFAGQSSTSPITISGLTNGDSYTCTVTATNSAGTSAASASSDTISPEALPRLPIWLLETISYHEGQEANPPLTLSSNYRVQSTAQVITRWLF